MRYAGTYFDYQHLGFKKNVKFFSTDRGITCFLSLKGVNPEELWSHGRKVHLFFPAENFMEESTLFYHGYLNYIRMLQENEVTNPARTFYLHFIDEDSPEALAFFEYLKSARDIYLKWREVRYPDTDLDTGVMIRYVHETRKNSYEFSKHLASGTGTRWGWSIIPDTSSGKWELAKVQYLPGMYGEYNRELYFMSENIVIDFLITKKKRPVSRIQNQPAANAFALATIKFYTDPSVLKDVLGIPPEGKIDDELLAMFVEKLAPYENLEGKAKNLQDAFVNAYQCFIYTYNQLAAAGQEIQIPGGNQNE